MPGSAFTPTVSGNSRAATILKDSCEPRARRIRHADYSRDEKACLLRHGTLLESAEFHGMKIDLRVLRSADREQRRSHSG